MSVYVLIALVTVYSYPLKQFYSGNIQIEFDSLKKCEDAKLLVENRFNTHILECLEIKK